MKVCLHSGQAVHISIQFDEFFDKAISKFILIQIELFFKKVAIQNLLGFPVATFLFQAPILKLFEMCPSHESRQSANLENGAVTKFASWVS